MIYFADLHIHSKYSRATSKDCDLPRLAQWAALKGVKVVTTGDFTHPAWRQEIKDGLVEAGDGLYRLRDGHIPPRLADSPGGFGPEDVRFLLGVEISSIYKKNGATRKVHNLIYMPDIDAMDRFSDRLDRIGNIKSDGRPILGLGSKELLEISLETTQESFFVPAHIWTPWFSILGSRSGFDSVEECFDELTPHIFALETGLSSDPEMNFRVSALDPYTLVSYSDTHSPAKLGRQVTIFRGEPGYTAIREGIRAGGAWARGLSIEDISASDPHVPQPATSTATGSAFVGTIDFYPEEGKYHLDGHRKCGVRLEPEETDKLGGRCPVCGQPVTVGVMNRVVELADRERGIIPDHAAPFWRLLPLDELLGQVLGVGPQSKKVQALYMDMMSKLGPELMVLWSYPLDKIAERAPEIVVEAVRRARNGEVSLLGGFDGEYGHVTIFGEGERAHFSGQSAFLPVQAPTPRRPRGAGPGRPRKKKLQETPEESVPEHPSGLNVEQLAAVQVLDRPVLVQAGPGTGKTRTLTHRIAALVQDGGADPSSITAVTFTRKAAQEMRERLDRAIPDQSAGCWIGTFHQLGARILDLCNEAGCFPRKPSVLDEDQSANLFREAVAGEKLDVRGAAMSSLYRQVSLLKQNLTPCDDAIADLTLRRAYAAYQDRLRQTDAMDLDDLLAEPVSVLRENPEVCSEIAHKVARHLLVDEFQDVNTAQYELVRLLSQEDGRGLFVIGDPNQAIYGFRGADRRFFFRFAEDHPSCYKVRLACNYRSQANVLAAAEQVLEAEHRTPGFVAVRAAGSRVRKVQLPNEATEAEFIVRTIDAFLGGASFFSIDSRDLPVQASGNLGFGDFAVLYRLNTVGDALEKAFQAANIPFQRAHKASPREEAEALDPRADAVTLMTIHASKGLEFPVVFVAGCEDGVVPFLRPGDEPMSVDDLGEERRLLYVAMTRACEDLFLIKTGHRMMHGRRIEGQWSRFLKDVASSLCEKLKPLEGASTAKREKQRQYELFT